MSGGIKGLLVVLLVANVFVWVGAMPKLIDELQRPAVFSTTHADVEDDDDVPVVLPKKKQQYQAPRPYSHREPCEGDAEAWNCGGSRKGYLEL